MTSVYDQDLVTINHCPIKSWDPGGLVDLWILSSDIFNLGSDFDVKKYISQCYSKSGDLANLVLWMSSDRTYMTTLSAAVMGGEWVAAGMIISGSNPIHIGYLYSKRPPPVMINTKLILDERGKRGPSSSKTTKFVLSKLLQGCEGLVADPFMHPSATIPIWCRRMGIRYTGRLQRLSHRKKVVDLLAQVELPGIQLSIPT